MYLGKVIGRVVATQKDENLISAKLLMIQPVDFDMKEYGKPMVALDNVGAGAAELVMWVGGREAGMSFGPRLVPVDAGIIGIVDDIYLDESSLR